MKKHLVAVGLSLAALSPLAQADTVLGIYVGGEAWDASADGSLGNNGEMQQEFNYNDETFGSYYVAVEHPIPLVPNFKVRYTDLDLRGSTVLDENFEFDGNTYPAGTSAFTNAELSHFDYTLYYEILDNDLVSVDLGLSAKQFDGDFEVASADDGVIEDITRSTQEVSGFVPLVYGRGEVGLPFTGLSAFAEGNFFALDGSKVNDFQVGIQWEFIDNMAVDMAIRAGYRSMMIELDDVDDIDTDLTVDGPFAGLQVHF